MQATFKCHILKTVSNCSVCPSNIDGLLLSAMIVDIVQHIRRTWNMDLRTSTNNHVQPTHLHPTPKSTCIRDKFAVYIYYITLLIVARESLESAPSHENAANQLYSISLISLHFTPEFSNSRNRIFPRTTHVPSIVSNLPNEFSHLAAGYFSQCGIQGKLILVW